MSVAEELERLDSLRKSGAITEEEFLSQKRSLLSQSNNPLNNKSISVPKRWSVQLALMFLLGLLGVVVTFFFPAYLIEQGQQVRISKLKKFAFQVVAVFVNLFVIGLIADANSPSTSSSSVNNNNQSVTADTSKSDSPPVPVPDDDSSLVPACDSSDSRELIHGALEKGVLSLQYNVRVLDIKDIKELSFDKKKPERKCSATVTLNVGGDLQEEYRLYLNSGKDVLIQIAPAGSGDSGQSQNSDN